MYCPPKSKNKTNFLDHITETYNFLSAKYPEGLYWLLAGDTNELKLDQILYLDPNLRQLVEEPTRIGSKEILDPINTDLAKYYHIPRVLSPLNPDCDCHGRPSDHKMILINPISEFDNTLERKQRTITIRPLLESKLIKSENWLKKFEWGKLMEIESSHQKADYFQKTIIEKFEFLPEKK